LVGLAPLATMRRRRPMRVHRTLVVGEFAAAILLLVGAGLLIRSWQYLERVDPGFRADGVFVMNVRSPVGTRAPQQHEFRERLLREIGHRPEVSRVGLLSDLFISNYGEENISIEGGHLPIRLQYRRDEVGGDAFQALGTRLLRGRFFSDDDRQDSPRVAIVNDTMARRLWGASDPVGRKFRQGDGPWFTVVGVIADMRRQGIELEPIPQMFEPMTQNPSGGGILVLRTSAQDPSRLIQAAVRALDKNALAHGFESLADSLAAQSKPRRVQTSLVAGFAAVAVLLAAIGIYGLIDYSITARRQEIGIRMAIGAQRADIFRMVLGEGFELSVTGLAIGLAAAVWAMRGVSSLLAGVSATDPLTLAAVSLLLLGVATCACLAPARRAMNVEPALAIRNS
jgi:putative ABC transport system permease protein